MPGRVSLFAGSVDDTLFLEGTDSLSADFHSDLLTVNDKSLGLKVGLPNFLGVALGEANVVAVLLAFAGEFADVHKELLYRS